MKRADGDILVTKIENIVSILCAVHAGDLGDSGKDVNKHDAILDYNKAVGDVELLA